MDMVREGNVLHLAGEFDVRHTAEVRQAIHELLMDDGDRFVLDVHEVSHVDLTALRVVGSATRLAAREGQRLVVRGCSPQVARMLHITRLARVIHVERESVPA